MSLIPGSFSVSEDELDTDYVEDEWGGESLQDSVLGTGRPPRRRGGRLFSLLFSLLFIAALALGAVILKPKLEDRFRVADYNGAGTGDVLVKVNAGDLAADIGTELVNKDVVKSVKAFTKAADADARSRDIQPGTYKLHRQMSAKAALDLLLSPKSKLTNQYTITEGLTSGRAMDELAPVLGLNPQQVRDVGAQVAQLGIPDAYGKPTSVEGFLFPATYTFDPGTTALSALQEIVAKFAATDRQIGLTDGAKVQRISPYQALIVASLVEAEAKFPEDRPKVARVIYQRLANHEPLGVDASLIYGLNREGKDPATATHTEDHPYNTRNRQGLPPTPISNPGKASLQAAVNPADGDLFWYVNASKDGHLAFFAKADVAGFEAAKQKCKDNGWGCN